MRIRITCLLLLASAAPAVGQALPEPLRADQLLLIYNAALPESQALAGYYAKARGVPPDRLCPVKVSAASEEISAADYESSIRRPVQAFLDQHRLRSKVRCLVTFYGLPIRVAALAAAPAQQRAVEAWKRKLVAGLDELERETAAMEVIGGPQASRPNPRMPTEPDYPAILQRYDKVRLAAYQRIQKGPATRSADDSRALMDIIKRVEGPAGLLQHLQILPGQPQESLRPLEAARERLGQAGKQIRQALTRPAEDPGRDEAWRLLREDFGLLGLLGALQSEINRFRTDETAAAVDSELALLWWGEYPKYRWIPNPLNWRNRASSQLHQQMPPAYWTQPVLLVSRIDGPSLRVARRIIDDAVAVERTSLAGRVYIDARGLKADQGLGAYDQSLRDLAAMLSARTPLDVHLDNRPEVFGPGQCPDAALYCGWYSLRQYVDAFTFARGAFAWHLASFECISLKKPGETGWCRNLLEHGAAATLGPVAEPYLESFPPPKDFVGLLLTGRFTLAECFGYTSPWTSWMQMLIGDPLYRPFAARPPLRVEDVFEPAVLTAATHQPTTAPAGVPAASR